MAISKLVQLMIPIFLANGVNTECNNPYEYDGKIKDGYLNCKEIKNKSIILSVKKKGERIEQYIDFLNDKVLDVFCTEDGMNKYVITTNGIWEISKSNGTTNSIGDKERGINQIKMKQTQYTNYLNDILELKKNKLEKAIGVIAK